MICTKFSLYLKMLVSVLVKKDYPILSDKAINALLPFVTTYVCETVFSVVAVLETNIDGG